MGRYIALILVSVYLLFIASGPVLAQMGSGMMGGRGKASDMMEQGKSMVEFESTPIETTPSGKIITLDDNGKTITLQVNESFLLKLEEEYDWNITIDDQTVLSRKVNVLVIRGAQGIYEAHKPGRATLTAVGDPPCRRATPPCAAPSRLFSLNVIVAGAATPRAPDFEAILAVSALFTALWIRRR
jgi:predicted secreted protein